MLLRKVPRRRFSDTEEEALQKVPRKLLRRCLLVEKGFSEGVLRRRDFLEVANALLKSTTP